MKFSLIDFIGLTFIVMQGVLIIYCVYSLIIAMKSNDCECQTNPQTQLSQAVTADNFWQTDLDVIESSFLPKGVKVTDLPVKSAYFN